MFDGKLLEVGVWHGPFSLDQMMELAHPGHLRRKRARELGDLRWWQRAWKFYQVPERWSGTLPRSWGPWRIG